MTVGMKRVRGCCHLPFFIRTLAEDHSRLAPARTAANDRDINVAAAEKADNVLALEIVKLACQQRSKASRASALDNG